MTLGSHQRTVGLSQDHITPKWIIDATGPFDLDPCASKTQPWPCARNQYTENGLEKAWSGFVFLNPPFDRYVVGGWISKLAKHGNGIALVHARTEAEWFDPIWDHADAVLFLNRRIHFHKPNGVRHRANSGAPPVLVAFGKKAFERLSNCGVEGALVTGWYQFHKEREAV